MIFVQLRKYHLLQRDGQAGSSRPHTVVFYSPREPCRLGRSRGRGSWNAPFTNLSGKEASSKLDWIQHYAPHYLCLSSTTYCISNHMFYLYHSLTDSLFDSFDKSSIWIVLGELNFWNLIVRKAHVTEKNNKKDWTKIMYFTNSHWLTSKTVWLKKKKNWQAKRTTISSLRYSAIKYKTWCKYSHHNVMDIYSGFFSYHHSSPAKC